MAKSPSKSVRSRAPRKATVRPNPEARATVSGPAEPSLTTETTDDLAAKVAGTEELAAAFPYNANKPFEYDPDAALHPQPGASVKPADPIVGASTVTERQRIRESRQRRSADRPATRRSRPLDRVRVDSPGAC